MSPLKDDAEKNKKLIVVTDETSQAPIGPCGPSTHSLGESFRHSVMAALSSFLAFGAHPVVGLVYTYKLSDRVIRVNGNYRG